MEPERLGPTCEGSINHPTHRQASGTELELDFELLPDEASPNVVDMGRSDIELRIGDTVFKTHTHLLVKFARLEELIDRSFSDNTSTRSIGLDRDEQGPKDMSNTFKILYASVITGPFEFEPSILISALRIATAYDYPALRTFAIERLEKENLNPIQRIELAREFGLTSWEEPAYNELYKRDEALTDQEAQILGMIAFAKVARMREKEKLELGKELGKQEYKDGLEREREQKEKTKRVEEEEVEREEEREEEKKKAEDTGWARYSVKGSNRAGRPKSFAWG